MESDVKQDPEALLDNPNLEKCVRSINFIAARIGAMEG